MMNITEALKALEQVPGHWYKLTSPFSAGDVYHAGLTPHETTGWNGRMDYRGDGATLAEAITNLLERLATGDPQL